MHANITTASDYCFLSEENASLVWSLDMCLRKRQGGTTEGKSM